MGEGRFCYKEAMRALLMHRSSDMIFPVISSKSYHHLRFHASYYSTLPYFSGYKLWPPQPNMLLLTNYSQVFFSFHFFLSPFSWYPVNFSYSWRALLVRLGGTRRAHKSVIQLTSLALLCHSALILFTISPSRPLKNKPFVVICSLWI